MSRQTHLVSFSVFAYQVTVLGGIKAPFDALTR